MGPISLIILVGGNQEEGLLCYYSCPLEHLVPQCEVGPFHKGLKSWLPQFNGGNTPWWGLIEYNLPPVYPCPPPVSLKINLCF